MGNEAGEWIIHGVTWDDPKCIDDVDEAVWRNEQWKNTGGLMIR